MLSLRNHFHYYYDKDVFVPQLNMRHKTPLGQAKILERMKTMPKPLFYREEVHFVDFTALDNNTRNPVYIATVRNPVDRFESR